MLQRNKKENKETLLDGWCQKFIKIVFGCALLQWTKMHSLFYMSRLQEP